MVDGAAEERKGFLLKCLCLGWKGEGLLVGEEWCPLKAARQAKALVKLLPASRGEGKGWLRTPGGQDSPCTFRHPNSISQHHSPCSGGPRAWDWGVIL